MHDVCCVPTSYDECIAMVKTGNECQLSAYMLLVGNLATAVCCAEVLFQQSFFVSLNALPGVLHAEWSTKRTTEPDTAHTERALTRLFNTASLDSRLHQSSKRVFHNIHVLSLFPPVFRWTSLVGFVLCSRNRCALQFSWGLTSSWRQKIRRWLLLTHRLAKDAPSTRLTASHRCVHKFLAVARAAGTHLSLAPGSFAVTAAHCRLNAPDKRLKASLDHACVADCSLCVLWLLFLHLCQLNHSMGRQGWSQIKVPSGWIEVIRGPRPRSVQWPSVKEHNQPVAQQGVSVSPKERHRLAPSHGSTTTWRARCPEQSFQTRKSCECDGRYARTSRGARQSRLDESQDSFEETASGRRNKQVQQVHHNGGGAHQGVGH